LPGQRGERVQVVALRRMRFEELGEERLQFQVVAFGPDGTEHANHPLGHVMWVGAALARLRVAFEPVPQRGDEHGGTLPPLAERSREMLDGPERTRAELEVRRELARRDLPAEELRELRPGDEPFVVRAELAQQIEERST